MWRIIIILSDDKCINSHHYNTDTLAHSTPLPERGGQSFTRKLTLQFYLTIREQYKISLAEMEDSEKLMLLFIKI